MKIPTLKFEEPVKVGPQITDLNGRAMDQSGYTPNGKSFDHYVGAVEFAPDIGSVGTGPVYFSEDFENWNPVPVYWSLTRSSDSSNILTHAVSVLRAVTDGASHAGKQHLFFRTQGNHEIYSATLALNLAPMTGKTNVWLEFWATDTPSVEGPGGRMFFVELSGDGQTWYNMRSIDKGSIANVGPYDFYSVDLSRNAATAGINLDSDVYVRFRFYNGFDPDEELSLDDVRIVSRNLSDQQVPMRIEKTSEQVFVFSFLTVTGFSYQVEFRDSLTSGPNWQSLAGAPHNSSSVVVTNSLAARFYRLKISKP
ncbi:MAG: hypothetical protein EXS31_01235 [Pedosphaera sp.]|nr:hypothetical protein [Pedosphaera sp.]